MYFLSWNNEYIETDTLFSFDIFMEIVDMHFNRCLDCDDSDDGCYGWLLGCYCFCLANVFCVYMFFKFSKSKFEAVVL